MEKVALLWFRQDLRLSDNPALLAAVQHGKVLPLYIFDEKLAGQYKDGLRSRCWVARSLSVLNELLDGKLSIQQGDSYEIIKKIVKKYEITGVFWNHCYEPWRLQQDKKIVEFLVKHEIECQVFHGSLLWDPELIKKGDGDAYKVYTPFYRNGCLQAEPPRRPLSQPRKINCIESNDLSYEFITNNCSGLEDWPVGEKGAQKLLKKFIKDGLESYKDKRNLPAQAGTSRLSPYLHHGEISPHQIWYAVLDGVKGSRISDSVDCFLSELGWREFSYNVLYHSPGLVSKNIKEKFDAFPWKMNKKFLEAWQEGQTGYPLVDAGMRELLQTGYMHNRVRMVVASFLIKNLLIHWHHGRDWFWEHLFDADLASNSFNWQWVAGSGADAAPYFRIFNPILQGEKFDKNGDYTRTFVPELANMPNKYLFKPWQAPQEVLDKAGIILGTTYPEPIVDLKESRNKALEAYNTIK